MITASSRSQPICSILLLLFGCIAPIPLSAQSFSPVLSDAPKAPKSSPIAPDGGVPQSAADGEALISNLTIDLSRREQSRIFYDTIFQASEGIPSGWNGNVAQRTAGTTSQAFRNAITLRINYFRAMAGVPAAITLVDPYNAKDQQAALMMSANNQLSHSPDSSWSAYTADGADAAHNSNLALGFDGPVAINAYVQDDGSNNAFAGHRRWLFYPQTAMMGTGDIDGAAYLGTPMAIAANALWVIDSQYGATRPATRDDFVAWPPPGYVPYQLIFNRWSFSYPGADFSQATISMRRSGNTVPIRQETVASEYGENTLVWVPDNLDASTYGPTPPAPSQDMPTAVTVSNVKINGVAQTFTYTVTIFDPHTPGSDTVLPSIGGSDSSPTGSSAYYSFNAVPGVSAYQWQAGTYTALTLAAGAESGASDVTFSPAGANLVTTAFHANGSAAYQLASEPATAVSLNPIIVPGPTSALNFNARLGYATAKETAKAQISTDGGATWQDLYTRTGTGGSPESGFSSVSISLGAYARKLCQIRFTFSNAGNYYLTSTSTGWFLDDITVSDAGQFTALAAPAVLPVGTLGFAFAPARSGAYALQVTPLFYGKYADPNLAGPLKFVAATSVVQQPQTPIFTNSTAANAWLGVPFSYQVTIINNPSALTAGMLPPGFSLDAGTGLINGTPAVAGTYTVMLNATNAAGSTSSMLVLTVLPPTPVIAGNPTVVAQKDTPFNYQISASPAPISFAATGLPDGLGLDASTGVISGVPTIEGDFNVTLSAANSAGQGTAAVTLKIVSAMSTVTASLTSDTLMAGTGEVGEFVITRSGDDLSQDLMIYYEAKGGAVAGTDYQTLKGSKKIKAGKQSAKVKIFPFGAAGDGTVKRLLKFILVPGDNYQIGDTAEARMKIYW